MLVLSRKQGEQIMVDDCVQLTVIEIQGGKVRLGFSAPEHVVIHRQEIYERIASTITNSGLTTEATM